MKVLTSYNIPKIHYTGYASKSAKQDNSAQKPSNNSEIKYAYTDLVKKPVKLGKEIKTPEEYHETIQRIINYTDKEGNEIFPLRRNQKWYPGLKEEEIGIVLYAGLGDLSNDINRYLSGRPLTRLTEEQAIDVIKAVDYSLNLLDQKYGKYSGFTYRQGFFDKDGEQYFSTTVSPKIAATLRGGIRSNKNMDFSIIKTNNGHKIRNFQKSKGSDYAHEEEEILLPRKNKYREITRPEGEYLAEKMRFIRILEECSGGDYNPHRIKVFEEI